MLEKNKDYIEFSMWSFMATHKPGQCTDINITGIDPKYEVFGVNNPFDIPCDVVVIPKKDFERLQADNQHYREMAKQWEENYNLLLKKTGFWKKRHDDIFKLVGFSSDEEIHDYLVNEAECDTLHEAILKLIRENKYACEQWCDANSSNNSWKAAATWITSYESACERGNRLADGAEEREKEWQDATGRISPEAAKQYIDRLKGRLNKIHGYSVDW